MLHYHSDIDEYAKYPCEKGPFLLFLKAGRSVDLHPLLSYPTLADKALFPKLVRPVQGGGRETRTEGMNSRAQGVEPEG